MSWINRLFLRTFSTEYLRAERLRVLNQKELAHRIGQPEDALARLNKDLGDIDLELLRRGLR